MATQLKVVDREEASSGTLLPTIGKAISRKPDRLKYLMIAPPKWGKTTFFSGCPGSVLLAFEAGYSEVDCPKVVITCWDRPYKKRKLGWDEDSDGVLYASAMEVIEEMEEANANGILPYKLAAVDTIDICAKMAGDYYCKLNNVEHPSDGGDWGKGWDLFVTRPVRMLYSRLVKLGIGVACITHSEEKDKIDRFGQTKSKRETSLSGKLQQLMHTQSDCIMHGMFAKLRKGQKDRDRYITFDGTNSLMAGTRVRKVYVPNKYIVTPPTREDDSPPWKQWREFFTNSPDAGQLAEAEFDRLYKGLDPETGLSKVEKKVVKKVK